MSIRKGNTLISVLKSKAGDAELTNLSITPSTSSQTFSHPGYDGYDNVSVSAVTSSIDNNIQAANIKKDVSILGVTGTYEGSGGGGTPWFTGHYDAQGLAQIGWSNSDIQYYQDYGVQWNSDADNAFKLHANELAGDSSVTTRYLPKNTTQRNFMMYMSLIAMPVINISNITDMTQMFAGCASLTALPLLDTSNVINMYYTFGSCMSLKTIPLLDTSNVLGMESMFESCYSLITIPLINTSKVTTTSAMFDNCRALKSIPPINMGKVTDMGSMFSGCYSLNNVPTLDTHSVQRVVGAFDTCLTLTEMGGLTNLGQAYLTTASANYNYYVLNLTECTLLTEQSIINVLNGLYNIAGKGCKTQIVGLGTDNLAKLTSAAGQQALSNAQAKGWTIM